MNDMILYLMAAAGGLLLLVVIAYLIIAKKTNTKEMKQLRQLRQGTKEKTFSMEIMYQRLYLIYIRVPFLKRYVMKLRRRLEIINIEKALLVAIPFTVFVIIFTHQNTLLMSILLIFELFLVETVMDGMVDKIDNKLLKQQIDFFAEIRHAYHEYNMVEEAIYQVAQDDEVEISRQAEKIYEILISDDPESELERYYDVAPNSYLKEFAGVSYLTKEFGDRQVDKASLYLKNLNNITQEMQLEILKRDKLDYVFQSLSVISAIPILGLEPLKNWAVSNFGFTDSFYSGKWGMMAQMAIIILTFVCYILIRKVKDSGSNTNVTKNLENPIQARLYKNKFIKKIVDLFIPKKGSADYRKMVRLLKESASKNKIEWLYVNRILFAIGSFIITLFLCFQLHVISVQFVYTEPTSDNNILGDMSDSDQRKAEQKTQEDNKILEKLAGIPEENVTIEGTPKSAYLIQNAEDLIWLAQNPGEASYAIQTNHISLNGVKWSGIGNTTTPFEGYYDGQGYTISGLTQIGGIVNKNGEKLAYDVGLFGVTLNATIKNIYLEGVKLTGLNRVGGIVGNASGTTTVSSCAIIGSLTAFNDNKGGVIGYSTAEEKCIVQDCLIDYDEQEINIAITNITVIDSIKYSRGTASGSTGFVGTNWVDVIGMKYTKLPKGLAWIASGK